MGRGGGHPGRPTALAPVSKHCAVGLSLPGSRGDCTILQSSKQEKKKGERRGDELSFSTRSV